MQDRMARIQAELQQAFAEELQSLTSEMARRMLDPAVVERLARALGIDASQLAGMSGRAGQQGFDPYQVLGLDRSAEDGEVRSRYRELAKKLHPDTSGTQGTAFLLRMVMAAYKMMAMERGWDDQP